MFLYFALTALVLPQVTLRFLARFWGKAPYRKPAEPVYTIPQIHLVCYGDATEEERKRKTENIGNLLYPKSRLEVTFLPESIAALLANWTSLASTAEIVVFTETRSILTANTLLAFAEAFQDESVSQCVARKLVAKDAQPRQSLEYALYKMHRIKTLEARLGGVYGSAHGLMALRTKNLTSGRNVVVSDALEVGLANGNQSALSLCRKEAALSWRKFWKTGFNQGWWKVLPRIAPMLALPLFFLDLWALLVALALVGLSFLLSQSRTKKPWLVLEPWWVWNSAWGQWLGLVDSLGGGAGKVRD